MKHGGWRHGTAWPDRSRAITRGRAITWTSVTSITSRQRIAAAARWIITATTDPARARRRVQSRSAQRSTQVPFQHHADAFAHPATVGAGLPDQIVIQSFGQVQLDIAVALGAAAMFRGQCQARGGISGGTFGHGGEFRATPRTLRGAWPQLTA